MTGLKAKVSWFNKDKGFGFAIPDVVPIDVLIDATLLANPQLDLTPGQRVYIEIERQQDGGYRACQLVPL
ncbi:cold shock domain-containing protein [Vibrio sp. CAU 1672]|uniref:cold shock domain-containing protein n=1 Tax=Vibrio sp. CAU 1672 TaxID=3032594 RepID=UPI0023DC0458|nr:cold shock domain-containing protein [Vibrio sp. CAU 1672]MDF2154599.1 cold shock domain-containing protein [Vibrio sp. CAU 1672]